MAGASDTKKLREFEGKLKGTADYDTENVVSG